MFCDSCLEVERVDSTRLIGAELSLCFVPQWKFQPDLRSPFDYVHKLFKPYHS